MTDPYTIYFAGDLFDHKHLIGNAILAEYINRCSDGKYKCIVPQDLEQPVGRGVAIRNNDLRLVLECDFGIFNFDGADLDSGTAVEFTYAKSLDIPAVLFRTDLRSRGEQQGNDPWNLMCSFYPRSHKVQFNGMAWYKEMAAGSSVEDLIERMYTRMAKLLIEALDAVKSEPPLPKGSQAEVEAMYRWALRFAGGGLEDLADKPGYVADIVARKMAKGMI